MTRALRVQSECDACACGQASAAAGKTCPFTEEARERGDALFHEGDAAQRVWFVKRGTVVMSSSSGDEAATRACGVRRAGAFVGLEALVHPRYLESARAGEPSIVCSAPLAQVEAWLGPSGLPARTVLEQHLRSEAHQPRQAASPDGTAVERVARWVIAEVRDREAGHPLMRRDVAGLLGMAPETFSRALASLVREGAIATNRRHVWVRNAGVLLRLAGRS
jgi:CRP-like cAMP-binding protein